MSSPSGGVAVAAAPKSFFCYQCDRVVTLFPTPNSDLLCPSCDGGFLEEYDAPPNPNPNPTPNFSPFFAPFSDPFSLGTASRGGGPLVFSSAGNDFNPFEFLQNHLQNLRDGGANIQFVIENHPSDGGGGGGGFQLPASLGDYFLGPGLEQLIQQLAENDPNRYGTPPASKKAIEGLPGVIVTEELIDSDSAQCAICMNDFELGTEVKQMPCKHIYHFGCLNPWLELHNSCPVCRHELPTDDAEYESRRGNPNAAAGVSPRPVSLNLAGIGNSGGGGGGGSTGEALLSPGGVERRFRISLPWPFNSFGGGGESEASGSSGQQGSEHGQGPRQEGLD